MQHVMSTISSISVSPWSNFIDKIIDGISLGLSNEHIVHYYWHTLSSDKRAIRNFCIVTEPRSSEHPSFQLLFLSKSKRLELMNSINVGRRRARIRQSISNNFVSEVSLLLVPMAQTFEHRLKWLSLQPNYPSPHLPRKHR